MKKLLAAFITAVLCGSTFAADTDELFPNSKPREYHSFEPLNANASIGGRAIYTGGRKWGLASLHSFTNNMGVEIGQAILSSPHEGRYFLEMSVIASISSVQEGGYFAADLCNPATLSLVRVSVPSGKHDNCLLVRQQSVNISGQAVPALTVSVRNSKSNWRLYDFGLIVSLEPLGFPNTSEAEWMPEAVAKDPRKKLLVEQIEQWARTLQRAVDKAMDYSKPATAFEGVADIESVFKPLPRFSAVIASSDVRQPNASIDYVYCPAQERMINPAQESCH